MKHKILKVISFLAPIIWIGFIYWSSSRSSFGTAQGNYQAELISSAAHVVLYFILTLLLITAFWQGKTGRKYAILNGVFIAVIYGALDEYHQHFVPGRTMSLADWLLDGVGAGIAAYVYSYWFKLKLK